jgi:hypothetical protein
VLKPTKGSFPFVARRKISDVLTALSDAKQVFHLAGSYYFGVATTESDVDLYAEYTPELVTFLAKGGFKILGGNDPSYPEIVGIPERDVADQNNTFAVFEHRTVPLHVQVFYDLPLALAARDILAKAFKDEHTRTRGPNRTKMWKAAEAAAREILAVTSPLKAS